MKTLAGPGQRPETNTPHSEKVLIVAPFGRDAELLEHVLKGGGIDAHRCPDVEWLVESYRSGAGVALIADEALNKRNIPMLAKALDEQPGWSDFPVLVMTGGGEATGASAYRLNLLAPLGNVTLIERPVRTATLVSAIKTALRARRHQYQIRGEWERQNALMAQLRESEAKLRFALDSAHLGAWELRIPEQELEISPLFRRNFGIASEAPFTYRDSISIIHPDDRDSVTRLVARAIENKTVYQCEYRINAGEGHTRWVWAAGRPVYSDDGSPLRLVGVTLDITERRQAEEAVRESESRLRALANSMPQMAWMANDDGYIFWYNERWFEYTGAQFEETEGWRWESFHDPEILPVVLQRWRECIASGAPFEMEFPLRGKDGTFRWFLTQSRPIANARGEVLRWFGTNTDIDDKKRAEKALRASEELARSVIQNSPDCVEVLDCDGQVLLVNTAGLQLLGVSDGGVPQGNWLDSWEGDERSRVARHMEQAREGQAITFEETARLGFGQDKVWEVSLTPIFDEDRRVCKLLCVSRDITERMRAEEELRQTAKLESLGVMAGGIAHDFNNLLTGILGNASLLAELPNPQDRELAEDIVASSQRAADLTRQMLAYSGKGRFEVRALDLSVQVREILRLILPMIDKAVTVELKLDENLPSVEADQGQMQQLIMNLAINGAEAMSGQPGRVTIMTYAADIDETFIAHRLPAHEIGPGRYVCLEVQDTGCGMDEETKSKIFDPFFTTKFTGRGLGLAAVSGIVRGHKGALRVSSTVGVGTTFRVFLPAMAGGHAAVKKPAEAGRLQAGQGTVLLVDDEEIVRRIARASLERQGYKVLVANNGREAIEVFKSQAHAVQLVILDMTMPVMGGEETLGNLREIRSDVPVIVCSGYNEVEVIRRFTSQGIAGFIQKPYTAASLAGTVKAVIDAHQTGAKPRP